jgi:hypothetical protein
MDFGIQASNPKISGDYNPEDESLDECVETSFLLNTEMALIEWLGVFIPVHYKYTVSTILLDIILMLELLLDEAHGELYISWPSSDFSSKWSLSWQEDRLTIDTYWSSVIGKTESILNSLGPLKISKHYFIREWKALLETVIQGLTECGYSESNAAGFSELIKITSRIDGFGSLYK